MRALLVVIAIAACQPSYVGTAFLCDAARGCPDGQVCKEGRCRRVSIVALQCGAAGPCTPEQQCCADGVNPPRCILATERCPGAYALCDSPDDCAPVERCCNGDQTVCVLIDDGCDDEVACATDDDCPTFAPRCCPQDDVPWGACTLGACD